MKTTKCLFAIAAVVAACLLLTGCEKQTEDSPVAGHVFAAGWEDGSNEIVYLYKNGTAELIQAPANGNSVDNTHLYWTEENNNVAIKYAEHKIWRQDLWNTTVMSGKFGYYDLDDEEAANPKGVLLPDHRYGMGIKFRYAGGSTGKLYILTQ